MIILKEIEFVFCLLVILFCVFFLLSFLEVKKLMNVGGTTRSKTNGFVQS